MSAEPGRVIGLGGVFRRVADPAATAAWYERVLGLSFQDWGSVRGLAFEPADLAAKPGGANVFSFFPTSSDYFDPSKSELMINLAVDDIEAVLVRCRREGVEPARTMLDDPSGRFAHILDPDGVMIELWEPVAASS
jgi:predicted enzyme related to lactoylglutathione lyase